MTVQRADSQHANGNFSRPTVGGTVELLTCGHSGNRHVSAVSLAADGTEGPTQVLAAEYDGQPLNSPNDVIVRYGSRNAIPTTT